ncbi:ribosomal protein S6 modification protein [Echinicola pacifica]|uniref:Ribosomal protein S6 modification protein n=1 Tax=Echinicola pacifica TaxID=346377 RepID=A0A918UU24_9BACT|nr:RimK/LysX family protein [Echinicola pacifica]GGZ33900.1 ribosomal protein S6 modification protein [Echinicola pacifica]
MKKNIIGRREKISLPEWGLHMISAKVDTGAYTNSIHCEWLEEKLIDGQETLEFILLSPGHRLYTGKVMSTENYTLKKVKSSIGKSQLRYKVSTLVKIFDETLMVEFTLTDRSKMRNSILLGRKMLIGRFVVDVEETNLSKKSKVPKP